MVKRMTPVAKAVASYATEPLVRHTKTSASAADRSGDPGVYAGLWPNRDPGAARRRRPPPDAAGRAGRPARLTGPRRPRPHQQVWAGPPHPLDHAWAPSVCAAVVRHPSLRYAVPSVQPRRGTCGECAQGQPGKCAPERALLLTRCPRNDRAGVAEGSLHGDHRLGGGGQRAGIEVPQIMEPHARCAAASVACRQMRAWKVRGHTGPPRLLRIRSPCSPPVTSTGQLARCWSMPTATRSGSGTLRMLAWLLGATSRGRCPAAACNCQPDGVGDAGAAQPSALHGLGLV